MEKNVNTLKKQLVAAIAMVLVSAVALGSSTFAWFVNNTSVEARGMHVNAIADGSLVIKGITNSADTAYSSVGTVGTKTGTKLAETLSPSTSKDGIKFAKLGTNVKVESADASTATWSGDTGEFQDGDLVTIESNDMKSYVLEAQYRIASVADDADIYLSAANVTVTNSNVEAALKMSITFKTGENSEETKVFNLGGGNVTEVGAFSTDTSKWALEAPAYGAMDSTNTWHLNAVDKAEDGTSTLVTVRVWYEGQDEKCYSNNVDTAGTDITLTFSKVPKQA